MRAVNEQSDVQRMIGGDDNVDKVNKYMKEDLNYERDRNQKLKAKINELDMY